MRYLWCLLLIMCTYSYDYFVRSSENFWSCIELFFRFTYTNSIKSKIVQLLLRKYQLFSYVWINDSTQAYRYQNWARIYMYVAFLLLLVCLNVWFLREWSVQYLLLLRPVLKSFTISNIWSNIWSFKQSYAIIFLLKLY